MLDQANEEYLSNDPVAKFQFDYNKHTCFVNQYPENDPNNASVSVAPGEGKIPKSILMDSDWDMRAFPVLDPTGENSLNAKRDRKLSYQQFFMQRLLNINRRFAESPSFLFAAVQYVESLQLQRNLNIAFQRGRPSKTSSGNMKYSLDDPYTVLDNIKGTPRYFKKKKNEFISKLENLGGFTFFFTLSCADMRWSENFTSLLHLEGYKIIYDTEFDKVLIQDPAQPDQEWTIEEFLTQNQGKHEFIRKNILNATRNFDNRVKNFIKTIIMSKYSEMHVKYFNYRVEFQLRGAGHIHGALWINFKEFVADKRNPGFDNIEAAFHKITEEKLLSPEETSLITRFADKFITVTLKDPSTVDIVKQVNVHHHTRACRKYGTQCRFFYPKFPIDTTLLAIPIKVWTDDEKKRKEGKQLAEKFLRKVKDVLEDDELMEELIHDNADKTPKERIIALLAAAFRKEKDVDVKDPEMLNNLYRNYYKSLCISNNGYKIVIKRDLDETMVNNYNPEFIKAWNGNCDLQICLDHFAIVTYICDYMMKDDSGTMEFIRQALKDKDNQHMKEKLKVVKNTFQTHRQIGEAECIYRIFPSFHLSGSNITTLFVHSGFRKNRSKMLREVTDEGAKKSRKDLIELDEHPDRKFELTTSLEDRYDDRPEALANISLAQFAKRYTLGRKPDEEHEDELDDFEDVNDDNQAVSGESESDEHLDAIEKDYIISSNPDHRVDLPPTIKIGARRLRLRRPLSLRLHRYKQTQDPHQHYFSLLRLYHPHSVDDLEIWENDQDACIQTYVENKESINYVKGEVMKYLDKVEQAQEEAQAEYDAAMANVLDAAGAQDQIDCIQEGNHENDEFITLDVDDAPRESLSEDRSSAYKKVELINLDELLRLSRGLDPDQLSVVSLGVQFATNMRKSRNKNLPTPTAPLIVVQGGAGCGKSFVISVMAQWMERIFRTPGDNPNHPYLLRCAFTGTASSLISGQTLHSSFHLPFGNENRLMGDKLLDEKRTTLRNLQVNIDFLKATMSSSVLTFYVNNASPIELDFSYNLILY